MVAFILLGPEWDSDDDAGEEVHDEQQTKKKSKKKKKDSSLSPSQTLKALNKKGNDDGDLSSSNVIYIGHIPPAFEEAQILTFFSQFGQITNIKLSRSRRTGNPRGYAFVQFDDEEVASIVANTMGGYLLMGERKLVCHVVPKDKVHPKLFQGSKRNLQLCQSEKSSRDRIEYWHDKQRAKVNKERSMEGIKKITKRLLSREKRKREQLKMLGIEYDFPGYASSAEHIQDQNDDSPTPPANEDETEDNGKESKKKKRKVSVDELETETETETINKSNKEGGEESGNKKKKKKRRKVSIDASENETADVKDETTAASTKKVKKSKKKKKDESKNDVKVSANANDDEAAERKLKDEDAKEKISNQPKQKAVTTTDSTPTSAPPTRPTRKIGIDSQRKKSLMLMVKSNVRHQERLNAASKKMSGIIKESKKQSEEENEDDDIDKKIESVSTPNKKVCTEKAGTEVKKKKKKTKKRKSIP